MAARDSCAEEQIGVMVMRLTSHSGRTGKDGAYSPKHNDRKFDLSHADHIDQSRTNGNWYWHLYQRQSPDMSFDDAEKRFYIMTFNDGLKAKNARYQAQRHAERCQTIDSYRSNPRTCPEETILQVGRKEQTIDSDKLKQICIEHINWEIKTFPNVQVLDVALHVDEQGAPHIHERKVWIGHDKDGNSVVGQAKALVEMGIEPPHPEKPCGRNNNAKMTYTAMCREHFAEICKEHGLEIELNPREVTKSGLALLDYKAQQAQERATKAEKLLQENIQAAQIKAAQIESQAVQRALKIDRKADKTAAVQEKIRYMGETLKCVSELQGYRPEILSETVEKRRLTGRIDPATVTISKADYDKLISLVDARETVNVWQQSVMQLNRISEDMNRSAYTLKQSHLNAHETAVDVRVQAADRRVEQLERARDQSVMAQQRAERERDAVVSERDKLQDENTLYREVLDFYPEEWEGMQNATERLRKIESMYYAAKNGESHPDVTYNQWTGGYSFDLDGHSYDRRHLLQEYVRECKAQHLPHDEELWAEAEKTGHVLDLEHDRSL